MSGDLGDGLVDIWQFVDPRLFIAEIDEAGDDARGIRQELAGCQRIDDALEFGAAPEHDLLRPLWLDTRLVVRDANRVSRGGEIEPVDAALDPNIGSDDFNWRDRIPRKIARHSNCLVVMAERQFGPAAGARQERLVKRQGFKRELGSSVRGVPPQQQGRDGSLQRPLRTDRRRRVFQGSLDLVPRGACIARLWLEPVDGSL